jgi:hypothetical protein
MPPASSTNFIRWNAPPHSDALAPKKEGVPFRRHINSSLIWPTAHSTQLFREKGMLYGRHPPHLLLLNTMCVSISSSSMMRGGRRKDVMRRMGRRRRRWPGGQLAKWNEEIGVRGKQRRRNWKGRRETIGAKEKLAWVMSGENGF